MHYCQLIVQFSSISSVQLCRSVRVHITVLVACQYCCSDRWTETHTDIRFLLRFSKFKKLYQRQLNILAGLSKFSVYLVGKRCKRLVQHYIPDSRKAELQPRQCCRYIRDTVLRCACTGKSSQSHLLVAMHPDTFEEQLRTRTLVRLARNAFSYFQWWANPNHDLILITIKLRTVI